MNRFWGESACCLDRGSKCRRCRMRRLSYCINSSMRAITSASCFRRLAPASRPADSLALDVLRKELAASQGDGIRVEPEQLGHAAVCAVTELEGFETGMEPALPFVENREEENDRGLRFIGDHPQAGRESALLRLRIPDVPGALLLPPPGPVRAKWTKRPPTFSGWTLFSRASLRNGSRTATSRRSW